MRTRQKPLHDRQGFALLAVLALMVGVVAIGVTLATTTDEALDAARNRVSLTRASWVAEGCAERARSAIDEALASDPGADLAWRNIDSVVAASPVTAGCDVILHPAGTRLDVNSAAPDELRALFLAVGMSAPGADSLTDALMDWRDADNEPRAFGAESSWYARQHRLTPRNGSFASSAELKLVRGVAEVPGIDSLLGVDGQRIWLDRAPLPVIAALPGMPAEAIGRIAERRELGQPIGDLAALADGLPPAGRQMLLADYAALIARTTSAPEEWTLTARASSGSPAVAATVELQLVRAGQRTAIRRRRDWP